MKRSHGFKIAAMIILAIMIVLWSIVVARGFAQGNPGGLNDVIMMVVAAGLAILAWKRPLLGGILVATYGIILALYFFLLPTDIQTVAPHLLLMCSPITLSGLFFIEAAWSLKRKEY